MKKPIKLRFLNWTIAWVELVVALINILTFNFYRPNWGHRYLYKISMMELKDRIKKLENKAGV